MNILWQKCKSCGWHIQPDKCQLLKIIVNPEEDYCSRHRGNIPTCDFCGKPINKNGIILDSLSENIHLICENCRKLLGTCHICDHAKECKFETDPSPLPKTIQKRTQQGPFQSVTTIKNPERIRITCQTSCPCFDKEIGCIRENTQTCKNNKSIY